MNKRFNLIVVLAAVIFSFAGLNAQTKVKEPKPPKLEKFDFDFDFDFEELKMSVEEEQKILKEMKVKLREQLKTIKEHNSSNYFNLLRESKFKNMRFPFMTKGDKEEIERTKRIFELEVESEANVAKYKSANTNKKQNLKSELNNTLKKLFDLKEVERKNEVKELEMELKELRKSLSIRLKNKNEIIKRRLHELLEEDEYLDWE
ncbi:MAG: hypothetical protein GY936_08835 [Ignavibacteriae bacterium]|nr:hypothetical protein [Ignavibacteriota bacterium]